MAELVTTEEEEAAFSFLDWDDESLGKAVKAAAITIRNGFDRAKKDEAQLTIFSAAVLIINQLKKPEVVNNIAWLLEEGIDLNVNTGNEKWKLSIAFVGEVE